jgi:hypothetical protein
MPALDIVFVTLASGARNRQRMGSVGGGSGMGSGKGTAGGNGSGSGRGGSGPGRTSDVVERDIIDDLVWNTGTTG